VKRPWTWLAVTAALLVAGPQAVPAVAAPPIAASVATAAGAAPADLAPTDPATPDDGDVVLPDGAAADARHPRPGPARPLHVAIGDSVPAGQQSVPPAVDFPTTAALWKANGFVARFHAALRHRLDCRPGHGRHLGAAQHPDRHPGRGCRGLELVNLSRTGIPGVAAGVTTATVLEPGDQLDQAVALLDARNQNRSARDDVEVVTVSIGGNDLYGPTIAACVPATTACLATLVATIDGFTVRYDQILRTLREHAGPDTLILGMTYYNPLPYCSLGAADPVGARAFGDFVLEGGDIGLGSLPLGSNDRLREVAARYDVTVVDTFGLLGADDFVGGSDCVHPDGSGPRAIARAFTAAVAR
jgi:lysophospholipase L1-like esterase